MTAGASSVSPRATSPDGGREVLRDDVFEQEAARTGPQRLVDVLVQVEGREHEDAGRDSAPGEQPGGIPSSSGMRMSVRIELPDDADRLPAVGGLTMTVMSLGR